MGRRGREGAGLVHSNALVDREVTVATESLLVSSLTLPRGRILQPVWFGKTNLKKTTLRP